MSRRTEPVWRPSERRWRLRCGGHDHYFSPAQRGLAATKEASKSEAKQWAAKVHNDAQESRRRAMLGIDLWEKHMFMCREAMAVAEVRHDPHAYRYFQRGADFAARQIRLGAKYPQGPVIVVGSPPGLPPDEPWDEDRSERKLLGSNPSEIYLAELLSEVQHGELSPQHFESIKLRIGDRNAYESRRPGAIAAFQRSFEGFLDARSATLASLDGDLWRDWSRFLRSIEGWSSSTKSSAWRISRAYVRWAVAKGMIQTLPANFQNRKLSLAEAGREEVPVLTSAQLAAVFAACDTSSAAIPKGGKRSRVSLRPDECRARRRVLLFALLALNVSCTSRDISDLRQSEVDLDAGIVRRRRSKTRRIAKVPKARYRLWPETTELLREFRSVDSELLLLHTDDCPLWQPPVPGGQHKCDRVGDAWDYLRRRIRKNAGIEVPSFGVLKKTSATLLERRCGKKVAGLFLGHSARSIQAKHYVRADYRALSRGLSWLRHVYFDPERRERVLARLHET